MLPLDHPYACPPPRTRAAMVEPRELSSLVFFGTLGRGCYLLDSNLDGLLDAETETAACRRARHDEADADADAYVAVSVVLLEV